MERELFCLSKAIFIYGMLHRRKHLMTVKPSFPMQITYCDKRLEFMFQADINKKWIEKMLIMFSD